MATRSKPEKVMLRQAVPGKASPLAEPKDEATVSSEPIAQWKDNGGDRLTYLFWLFCFGVMAAHVLIETAVGFMSKR